MKPKIIFDTDIGCDCDDAAALALALELQNAGECELLAVTHCTEHEAAAGCIEAILKYYGHPEIPIGSFHENAGLPEMEWRDVYASAVALRYDTGYRRGIRYPDTVGLLRKTLEAAEDDSITLTATGSLSSLSRLLKSGPDEFSAASGTELIQKKVIRTVCMAGRFAQQWNAPIILGDGFIVEKEWNVTCDVEAARKVCAEWPNELIFCSYEIGLPIITCGDMQLHGPENNPVRTCYEVWSEEGGAGAVGRESWDGAAMLYAVRPDSGYWKLHPYGRIQVDEEGRTEWIEEEGGRQSFLIENMDCKEVENIINGILNRGITGIN